MSIVAFDRVTAGAKPRIPVPTASQGFWARLFNRFVEARERRAMVEIRRYRHLLPRELDDAEWKSDQRCDSLPFGR